MISGDTRVYLLVWRVPINFRVGSFAHRVCTEQRIYGVRCTITRTGSRRNGNISLLGEFSSLWRKKGEEEENVLPPDKAPLEEEKKEKCYAQRLLTVYTQIYLFQRPLDTFAAEDILEFDFRRRIKLSYIKKDDKRFLISSVEFAVASKNLTFIWQPLKQEAWCQSLLTAILVNVTN